MTPFDVSSIIICCHFLVAMDISCRFVIFDFENTATLIRVTQVIETAWYHSTDYLWFGFLSVLPIASDKQSNGRPVGVSTSLRLNRDVELSLVDSRWCEFILNVTVIDTDMTISSCRVMQTV